MKQKQLFEIASTSYILLFSYAAAAKLMDTNLFTIQLGRQIFSPALVPFLVWGIPLLELAIVALLIIPRYRLLGLKAATGLMIIFTGYITLVKFGAFEKMPCSCGGVISKMSWTQHLYLNLAFLLLGGAALILNLKRREVHA